MDEVITIDKTAVMPLLPLRGISIFPGMLLNFDVERSISVTALNTALGSDQLIFLVAQKDAAKDMPTEDDLYRIGTICRVKQLLRVPGGPMVRVMVEGLRRAKLLNLTSESPCFFAKIESILDEPCETVGVRTEALLRRCYGLFDEYISLSGTASPETLASIVSRDDPGYVSDFVAQNVYLRHTQKQILLAETNPVRRLELVNRFLKREIDILSIEQGLQERAHEQLSRNQRTYFLREQMRLIQAELGEGDEQNELDEYRERIVDMEFGAEVEEKLLKEVTRLGKQHHSSSEAAVIRNYLDIVLELPWKKTTKETLDIKKAQKILDDDHFGLEKVKERVIEFLAVRQLAPGMKGGVLCLVGPPGVGKTSVAISIARATNRKLARLSLGGVHDEAEIRGHRKTYVGAMPGRIINGMSQAKSKNPVLLLDEVDKLGSDFRGDPSAALLEALDTEQNYAFRDHFLELPYDLSDVFFITTANTTDTIPRPLLDRMEVIQIGSYTDEEKLQIAKRHLLPKQRKKHGLKAVQLKLSDDAIREIIALYTRESGVRILERELAAVCRKTAVLIAEEKCKSQNIKSGMLEPLLGAPRYKPDIARSTDEVGLVRGLAWTSVGGETLDVEVGIVPGSGKLELTGNLGNVMKESAHAAITYIRSRSDVLGIDPDFHKNKDIHIHFPEGAVPKDGPSAGMAICVAVISALTNTPARRDVAMTGEITLRGRILPIGGLREKTMAALRAEAHTVIVPSDNEKDIEEIDQTVRGALNFVLADHVDNILDIALVRPPVAVKEEKANGRKLAEIVIQDPSDHSSPVNICQ